MIRLERLRRRRSGDAGFTLVELLIGMIVFGVLSAMIASAIAASTRSVDNTKQLNDVNEEARLTQLRFSRELRQAGGIDAASLFTSGPYASKGYAQSITISADFNGNEVIEPNAVDPETLTYRYTPDPSGNGNGQINLVADDAAGNAVVRPILSGHVSDFYVELRSSVYTCDTSGDGITTWQELDTSTNTACAHPNNNGLDQNELSQIDSVVLSFSIFEGRHKQTYTTQINLRNVGVTA